jgi:CRISPR-associated protein Csc1
MIITKCKLTLHDHLFYATREMGRLYETGHYLHNYSLVYALGLVKAPYFHPNQMPNYQAHLQPLNRPGIYVTPARPVQYDFVFHIFKRANVGYYSYQPQTTINMPIYGRAKELAVGGIFEFYVISHRGLALPHWIRLGKWMSKAEIEIVWQEEAKIKNGSYTANHPLNPLDVPATPLAFDLISMPPVSLLNNARFIGDYYEVEDLRLPAHMRYTFPEASQ